MDLECSFTEEYADEELVQGDVVVRLENSSEPRLHNSSEPVTPPRHTRCSNTLRSYLTTSSAKRKLKNFGRTVLPEEPFFRKNRSSGRTVLLEGPFFRKV